VTVSLQNDTFLRYDRQDSQIRRKEVVLVEGEFAPLFLGRFEHWNELHKAERDDEFVQNVCYPVIIGSGERSSKNAGAHSILCEGSSKINKSSKGESQPDTTERKEIAGPRAKRKGGGLAVAPIKICTGFANTRKTQCLLGGGGEWEIH
jgi:hypothetical protein